MSAARALRLVAAACALAIAAQGSGEPVAPKEHLRPPDQTFLTYPEWFLVHSPAEYAVYVRDHAPSGFPFWGHVRQFWQGYATVREAIRDYPFNFGYHVMIVVIGSSTTVEYLLRLAYETLVGRLTELTATHGMTEEDRYGARVAQDYVDFIRVLPWYEYDFAGKLAGLWRDTSLWGPDVLRKWERKYALTTEYAIKAAYGWLIKKATKASYDEPLPVTAVLVDRLPADGGAALPELKVLERRADGSVLVTVPRYEAFKVYAAALAKRGANFLEIAGNRSGILVTVLAPRGWRSARGDAKLLFTQPILTRPAEERVAVVVPVASLAALLLELDRPGIQLEHVYDY